MTQRIFDVDNPQDVKDLFDLVPNKIQKIRWSSDANIFSDEQNNVVISCSFICIAWRGKTEIIRPVDGTSLIGKLCWFKDSGGGPENIGILKAISERAKCKYMSADRISWELCRPVRRDEVKFADDVESKE